MKLEFVEIAGEEIAFVLLQCSACGKVVTVREREMKTTSPVNCSFCNHSRYLSYREYVTIADCIAAELLEHTVLKFGGRKNRSFRSLN